MMDPGHVLASLVEMSDAAVISVDLDARVVAWSGIAERIYGYSSAEIVGQPLHRIVRAAALTGRYEQLCAGQPVAPFADIHVARDGREVHVIAELSPVHAADGRVAGALLTSRETQDRGPSSAALQASEERWRALLDSAVDAIVVIDAGGHVEAFNPAAERLFGYSEREMLGRNVNVLMPSPYREEHDEYLARYLREGNPRIIGIGREVTGRRRDGGTFPVHLSVGEMSLHGERKFTGILHDLSARVAMEEQLREQAALVRLGEMAAVIAHEVKNPLAGIRGAIQVIGTRLTAGSPEAAITGEIVARIDALSELMKDLLLFARPPRPQPALVEIPPLVASTAELLTADPALSHITVEIDGGAPHVLADAGLLRIVFVNLLANSAHAMNGRGVIRVSVRESGNVCAITIRDSGPGIPPDVREKIFTPFFTTKSRGTGLGLPTARRLIEAHHGSIHIESPNEGGTAVIIQLPLRS